MVHRAAVIPHHQIVHAPAVGINELPLGRMRDQLIGGREIFLTPAIDENLQFDEPLTRVTSQSELERASKCPKGQRGRCIARSTWASGRAQ